MMSHVVYRGGTPALNDVLAAQIPMTFATVTQALPQYQTGLVRALGVTATERHRAIPNVPTFREQGFDLLVTEWYGLLAPAGTPKPIIAKLNAEMRRILALPLGERVAAIDLRRVLAGGAWQLHPQRDRSLDAGDQATRAEGKLRPR